MRIVVVGDVLLDRDIDGTATRLCPDSAAPVIDATRDALRPGGAGLVARMLRKDGCEVTLVTVLSTDAESGTVRELLAGIPVISGASRAPTPVKTRIMARGRAICRVDRGCGRPPLPAATAEMMLAIEEADAVIVADYGRRLTEDPALRETLSRRGGAIPVIWDPHPLGEQPVPGCSLVTPNLAEASAAACTPATTDGALRAAPQLRERYGASALAITLGASGALVCDGSGDVQLYPAATAGAVDPCGAGDRFTATAGTILARGGAARAAVSHAVRAATAYVSAGGVASLDADTPEAPPEDALDLIRLVRARGGTVVATGGCFDLLHAGHARTLAAARSLGDCLVVCLNSDASVRRLKGPQRPIVGAHERAELLRSLACVDAVIVFEEDGPESILAQIRPDIWVKGGDYRITALPETPIVERWGGRVITVPFHPGHSTTGLASALARVG